MRHVHLLPAQSLVEGLTRAELLDFSRRARLRLPARSPKRAMVAALTRHVAIDELADRLLRFFPRRLPPGRRRAGVEDRLDRVGRLSGEATVQVYSRSNPGLGRMLLSTGDCCLAIRFGTTQLFLENRWPVLGQDVGRIPLRWLYAAYVGKGRVHPAAQAAPPSSRPFILDEGEYGLGNSRLRLEFRRSGPLSFRVACLRYHPRLGRPEYLLLPIV